LGELAMRKYGKIKLKIEQIENIVEGRRKARD
jgi:hypothetical protein